LESKEISQGSRNNERWRVGIQLTKHGNKPYLVSHDQEIEYQKKKTKKVDATRRSHRLIEKQRCTAAVPAN
jgi:hypothetical protein